MCLLLDITWYKASLTHRPTSFNSSNANQNLTVDDVDTMVSFRDIFLFYLFVSSLEPEQLKQWSDCLRRGRQGLDSQQGSRIQAAV
jgi:hypothetical protein